MLISLQFVLGVWVALFGTFPSTDNVGTALRYTGDPVLSAHYAIAVIILILAVVLVVLSLPSSEPRMMRWLNVAGLLSLLGADAAGVQFILSGFSNDDYSFGMAVAFIVAMVFYGIAQAVALPDQGAPAGPAQKASGT